MSILGHFFGYDLFGNNSQFNHQAHANQLAAMGEYYQQYYNNQKSQENVKQEVKDDPKVIDAEFEVIEVKELEKF